MRSGTRYAYFNSVITALAEPRTTSSVWMRSRLLKRMSPDLYSFTTDLPFGSADCRVDEDCTLRNFGLSWARAFVQG